MFLSFWHASVNFLAFSISLGTEVALADEIMQSVLDQSVAIYRLRFKINIMLATKFPINTMLAPLTIAFPL